MSFPTASTPSPVRDQLDLSFSSSQSSNPDASTLCFESSFRLEPPFPNQKADSEKHPKGKRKRTTSQDKTILEAAYNSNPKPDKAARLDIVKRVSLNEKEVQIWFQNRRQNDRRKSRPLSPQEIEALRYGNGMRVLSSDAMPAAMEQMSASIALPNAAELPHSLVADISTSVEFGEASSPEDVVPQHRSQPSSPSIFGLSSSARDMRRHSEAAKNASAGTPPSPRVIRPEGESRPYVGASTTPIGYLANRWFTEDSFSSSFTAERAGDDSFRKEWESRPVIGSRVEIGSSRLSSFSSSTSSAADHSPPVLQPQSSSSQIRLSLSLDGKAELVSALQSPPRPGSQLAPNAETLPPVFSNRTLQRSRSAVSSITLPPISTLTKNLGTHFPPLARGRSRDVHAWESCCEADTRDELTRQAENESSGSAIAAISLVRSSSSSASLSNLIHNHHSHPQPPSHPGILQPNPGKRNTFNMTRGPLDRKPKLARAKTSPPLARYVSLEEVRKAVEVEDEEGHLEPEKKKRKKQANQFDILSPSGDSDKENLSPDEDGNPGRQHPLPPPETGASPTKVMAPLPRNPRRVGRILGEQDAATKRLFLHDSMDARNRIMSRASTAPTQGQRQRKFGEAAVAIFEDGENMPRDRKREIVPREGKRAEDVEHFMRGELSPSKRPDMDCVAGLLSLSQGNWR
ncbi:hypothetical protein F5B22DRAFT_194012 [Xylaria bambusicola]|uniref:uncharacterized protein n=1 Tax=Xylaria bambusicola TaxID=326684 RepID=UPI002008D0FA|nr:uncharacterized protein F5B22DRAFT_194012 [Xylaria bambusicola]KAI0515242.1 hypothetical protein F5B22DRAFT_194012 [Xylaria bambusicola]